MNTIQQEFDKLREEQIALRVLFQIKAQELFKGTTKEFFEKNPSVTAIIWTQYTPYFNDGDSCEFGVSEPYFTNVNEEQMEDLTSYGEYEGEDDVVWSETAWIFNSNSDYVRQRREQLNLEGVDPASIDRFSTLIQSDDMEDVMEAMFGDHARIVATRDGFEVNEYNHD